MRYLCIPTHDMTTGGKMEKPSMTHNLVYSYKHSHIAQESAYNHVNDKELVIRINPGTKEPDSSSQLVCLEHVVIAASMARLRP